MTKNESSYRILAILESTRAMLRSVNIGLFACAAAISVAASVFIVALLLKWGGFEGAPAIIAAFIKTAAFGAFVYSATRWLVFGVFYAPGERQTALAIEKSVPGLNNDLVVSLDLIRSDAESRNLYSPALADAHVVAAAGRLEGRDFSAVVPRNLLKRLMLFAGGAFALVVLTAIIDSNSVSKAASYLFSASLTPNPSHAKNTESPLLLGDFTVHYDYPAYTGLEPKDTTEGAGSIRAIKGSVVTIRAKSGDSLKSAKLTLDKAELPAILPTPKTIEAKITLMQNGRYRISALGRNDEKLVEAQAHSIEVIADAYPEIGIISPAEDREVEEAGVLPLEFASKDDFGLNEVAVVYTLNGKEGRIVVTAPEEKKLEVSGTYTWDLAALNLRPGDELRYFLEAVDNDAVSGPKKGASKTYTLSIYSPRKEHNRLVDLQWELLDKMVAVLGNTLVRKPMPAGDVTEESLKQDRIIADGLEDVVKRLDEIVFGLKKDRLGDLNTLNLLENMSVELKNLLAQRKSKLNAKKPSDNELARRQEAEIPVLEADIIALDNELDRQKVSEALQRGDDLLETQRNISDLLQKAQGGDKNAMAALEKELARMQELMQEMMEALSRSKGELPDDFINADALKNMPAGESADAFAKMREAIEKGDLEQAMKMAMQMQDMLAKMMAAMEGGAQSFGQSRSGEAMKRLAQIASKVDEVKEKQKKLFEETQNIGVEAQEKLLEKQKAERKDSLDRLKKLMVELRAKTDDTREVASGIELKNQKNKNIFEAMSHNVIGLLDNLLTYHVPRAEELLGEEDFLMLLPVMQQIRDMIAQLSRDAKSLPEMGLSTEAKARSTIKGADEMLAIAEEILDILEKILAPPNRQLSDEDKKRLMEMANEQQKLSEEARQLEKAMEEFTKDFPMMDAEQKKKMGQAGDAMGSAGKKLGATDPNGALSPEALALQKLNEIGDAMKQLQQRMAQGASGMPIPIPMPGGGSMGGMGNNDHGYDTPGMFHPGEVEIPGREGYKVPEKYREEILRAMQQKSPQQYQQLNRDYYKKLVE